MESIAEQAKELMTEWIADRPRGGDLHAICEHSAYLRLIELGEPAVPAILEELDRKVDHWFIALSRITGAHPVRKASYGKIMEMAAAWIGWGIAKGYIPEPA